MESLVAKLGRLTEQLADGGKFATYREASKTCTSLESKINCCEKILGQKVTESRGPITKNNGRGHNGGQLFTESDNNPITETADPYRGLGFSESDLRKLNNLPPVGSPNLTATQLREYRWARSIRLNESDSLKLALKVA